MSVAPEKRAIIERVIAEYADSYDYGPHRIQATARRVPGGEGITVGEVEEVWVGQGRPLPEITLSAPWLTDPRHRKGDC